MSYSVVYLERAIVEYEQAVAWYKDRSQQAAENFKHTMEEKINVLRSDPLRYKNTYKQFHEVALKKYPYGIIYFIEEKAQQIIITSLYHHKRSPKKKFRK